MLCMLCRTGCGCTDLVEVAGINLSRTSTGACFLPRTCLVVIKCEEAKVNIKDTGRWKIHRQSKNCE